MPDLFGEETPQERGGKVRAERLSAEKRREIAKAAAAARWGADDVLKATHDSGDHPLRIGDKEIQCYVLEDGRRVLSLGGMVRSLGMSIGSASKREGDRLFNFATGKALSPFVSEDLISRMKEPVGLAPVSPDTQAVAV